MDSENSPEKSSDGEFVVIKPQVKKAIKKNDSTKKVVKKEKVTGKKSEEPVKSPKRKQPKKNKKESSKKEEDEENKENDKESQNVQNEEIETNKLKISKPKPVANQKNVKAKSGNRDDASNLVLEYMRKQNRPYSLQNIIDNLHGEIKKTQGQKILDQLTEEGELQMKEYGKAKIYLINQKNVPEADPLEMESLKNELNGKKTEHTNLTNDIKSLKKKEQELNNQLTNEEIDREIEKFENLISDLDKKIEFYKSTDYVKLPDEIIKEAEANRLKYEKEYKKRKRMCMDMISQLAENMDKKLKEVEEMIGIEKE